MNLYTVEMWKPDPFDTRGKWVYTIKTTEYSYAQEHKKFLESFGYKARVTPELN